LQDDKKKKKASNKIIELAINARTHGYSQVEFDRFFEMEVRSLILKTIEIKNIK
jgi:hypothetical protein